MTGEVTETTPAPAGKAKRRGGLLLEFAMIILGALLALALDDWRDNQERDERDRVVMELVVAELAANRQLLENERRYHDAMIGPMSEASRRMDEDGVFGLPEGWEGPKPMVLTTTAFDLAVMTGVIARMPADTALSLARVYDAVETAERRRQNVSLTTLQTNFRDGSRFIRLQEVAVTEEAMAADQLIPLMGAAEAQVLEAVR